MYRLLGRAQPVIPPNLYYVNEHNSLGSPGNVPNIVGPVFLVYKVQEAVIANYLLLANSKRPFMLLLRRHY